MVLDMSTEDELRAIAADLATRYPDEADQAAREAALDTARRLLAGDTATVDELTAELAAVRQRDAVVKAALGQAARMVIKPGTRGTDSEVAFARRVGVHRLTVRDWLGK